MLSRVIAAAAETPHVRAELVSDAAVLEPGGSLRVGVRLVMDEGWHVYWTNPGDAGLATEVTWELPVGFEARRLEWPLPETFDSPGEIASYGYSDEVTLAVEVRIPADPPASAAVTAAVAWLACRDRCVLGEAVVHTALPLAAEDAARGRRLLEAALDMAPSPVTAAPFEVQTVTRIPAGELSGTLVAWISWLEAPAGEVTWYPDAVPGLKVADVQTRTRGSLTRIDARVRVMNEDAPTKVPSVLVVESVNGRRAGWRLPLVVRDRPS